MDHPSDIHWLRQRLSQPLPGLQAQERMLGRVIALPPAVPPTARQSAVLCLLYPHNHQLHLLLMKRMEDHSAHSGQVSFPGGRAEESDPSMLYTALREANEEVGVNPNEIDVLGSLSPLYIPVSNFNVHPFVGYLPQRPALSLSAQEVKYAIETPLHCFLNDDYKVTTSITSPAAPQLVRKVRAYQLADGTIVWGATAMIISELEVLLKESR
jgi:8-oxo-dGTP pyrophosphatase MutT (NUDIX family)